MRDESLWRRTTDLTPHRSQLPREVDVLVVGGGITGLTAAYLLARSGKRVAVVDREIVGSGETGNTSAHLTAITDLRLSEIDKRFGREAARLVWDAGAIAIDMIESIVEQESIDCGFARVPGWLISPYFDDKHDDQIRSDADVARAIGVECTYRDHGPLGGKPAVGFPDQAVFHPLHYLNGLSIAAERAGVTIVEHAEVSEVLEDPLVAVVNGQNVACGDVVIATHVPIVGAVPVTKATLFQTKLYPYSTYVIGGRIDDEIAPGLYEDTASPYHYLRVHRDEQGLYAIYGANDHKTGQASDTDECFAKTALQMKQLLPSVRIDARWTGQVIETNDGLPFIGENAPHQYISTGYAGNGLTFGTLGGLITHDAIMGVANPWRALFEPSRKKLDATSIGNIVTENIDYPLHFVLDRLRRNRSDTVRSIKPGEGKVLTIGGKAVACSRKHDGTLVKVSAVCTHMGCLVRWNTSERTWDCPCHGSRFTDEGLVLGGPAEAALEKMD
jgi:glycine/D-amino acid oxidase-like deaminating enzyme/nitrite reductase/ring-hydroxylating ferredoxin subunit